MVISGTVSDIHTTTYWLKIANFIYRSLILRPISLCVPLRSSPWS